MINMIKIKTESTEEMTSGQTYYIKSNYENDFYIINEDGEVLETENGKMREPYSNWVIVGGWYSTGYGHTRHISLEELLSVKDFKLKNGKPKYGLIDIDHGTYRMHGNKDVHGIRYIIKNNAPIGTYSGHIQSKRGTIDDID